ncbi:MAG: glycosyltransferase family 2 protein [Candidatus Heimdallarchaeaceae archaeon]
MKGITVSVVIPTLNEEENIAECLESLIHQDTYEIIIIDNESNDRTVEIASKYTNKIYIVPRETELGTLRQIGTEIATGDIIVQADADTRFPPNYIEQIKSKFMEDKELAAVYGRVYDYEGNAIKNISMRLLPIFYPGAGNCAFRRDMFMKTEGFPDKPSGEMVGMFRNMRKVGKVSYDKNFKVLMKLDDIYLVPPILLGGMVLTFIWLVK